MSAAGNHRAPIYSDRYIPLRSSMDFDSAYMKLTTKNDVFTSNYQMLLHRLVTNNTKNILAFNNYKSNSNSGNRVDDLSYLVTDNAEFSKKQLVKRKIIADKVLDAPGLGDDYFFNLLDWGRANIIAVGLGYSVYLWNALTGSTSELITVDSEVGPVTSINWSPNGFHLAIGFNHSEVQLWDPFHNSLLRTLKGLHNGSRVGSLAWKNSTVLTSGGANGCIVDNDLRIGLSPSVKTYKGHVRGKDICGLKWSDAYPARLASGSRDTLVHIWDAATSKYVHRLKDHAASVRALSWCPFKQNLLATGGGAGDNCVKFWNTVDGTCLNSINVGSEVCALLWNEKKEELLSSCGNGQEQLTIWEYPKMVKVGNFVGHADRVLYMSQSPDGSSIVTGSGGEEDETLRLWLNVFPKKDDATRSSFSDSFWSRIREFFNPACGMRLHPTDGIGLNLEK